MTHSNAAEVALTCQIDNKIITSIPSNTMPQVTSLIQITHISTYKGFPSIITATSCKYFVDDK